MRAYAHTEGRLLPLTRRWQPDLPPDSMEKAQLFADLMRAGAAFPPVLVMEDEAGWLILDGWHRLAASVQLGYEFIPALISASGPRSDYRIRRGAG
jgi:ParB-like chromosome segregation protein Spo0J